MANRPLQRRFFINEEGAWLSNAWTKEQYRGMEIQQALLNSCVEIAIEAGKSLILTDTSFGPISHRNIFRSDFELAYMTAELKLNAKLPG